MSKKTSVAILFGGKSVEHAISINSAKNIAEYIDKGLFEPLLIGISPQGQWFLMDEVNGDFNKGKALNYSLSPQQIGFISEDRQLISPDIVFPVLHGTDGEDGTIQGMLKAMNIPFVGTGVLGSAVSMNKLYSKKLMNAAGIPTSKFCHFSVEDKDTLSYEKLKAELGLPFMTKAANLGSSVGIYKVESEEEFKKAVDGVFKYDNTMLCESFVKGRELECSVMGNQQPVASVPGEIVVSSDYAFYTYEAKYLDPDAAKLQIPAKVSDEISEEIRKLSIESYRVLGCEDFARVDLFLKEDGSILINEINTIPGFTNSSMFPMMWQHDGISFADLITKIINMAEARFDRSKKLVKTYKPD
ncbi:D-alanine--D-alanine ligase [Fulvivirga sp. RKSG066]|uniref:D-alanine--D-alanine ligase family protein n=1 Tax=Fulvivirga aurantia TaxID=2529383 RepID=UPI0012BBA030|nr:D-alanine--D-alanine ligase family protein [Fulvivirga aurantia]MTI21531.1 D-alanine--D-alanine ligase [Fulvivirga aurantia]